MRYLAMLIGQMKGSLYFTYIPTYNKKRNIIQINTIAM